jgi:hypothetical protein
VSLSIILLTHAPDALQEEEKRHVRKVMHACQREQWLMGSFRCLTTLVLFSKRILFFLIKFQYKYQSKSSLNQILAKQTGPAFE